MLKKIAALAASIPWAIRPEMLATILAIANGEGPGPEAVAAQLGRPLDNTRSVETRGRVAVIPISGPIFRRANLFCEVSGATSIEILARDFNVALNDPNVGAIVFDVDSPGGEVAGVHEFANMIVAARGRKPIVAYAGSTCCSAAYWLASACDEIVVDETAQIGSIGVIATVADPAADTTEKLEFVSSQSPNKSPDLASDEGRALMQAKVDTLAEIFVADVARNRGVEVGKVLTDFGRGGELFGSAAVAAGMVTGLGSLEGVIGSLNSRRPPAAPQTNAAPAARIEKVLMARSKPLPRVAAEASADDKTDVDQSEKTASTTPQEPALDDTIICPHCGAGNEPDAKFCDQCGAQLVPSAGANATAAICTLAGTKTLSEAIPIVAGALACRTQLDAQSKELEQLRASARETDVGTIVAEGLRAGKRALARDEKNLLIAAGADANGRGADPARLRMIVAALPVEVKIGGEGTDTPPPKASAIGLTARERARCKAMGWSEEDYAQRKRKNSGGVPSMKEED